MTDQRNLEDSGGEDLDSRIDELLRRVARVPAAEIQAAETLEMPLSSQVSVAAQVQGRWGVPPNGAIVDGRYRIEGKLGEGAMGVVLSAHNLRTGREVALKYMLGDEGMPYATRRARVERFVREAQAVGRVRDPHVVDIYDVGGDLDAPYLVMERLRGESLRERMRAGALPESDVIGIALEAARGVSAAHRQGVIHRDLKPDNLFLAHDERGGFTLKVLDFGVSRILVNTADLATITRSGTIVGTPAYMPLEQLRGDEVDARVDVYALGAIMYEALSTKLPYAGRTLHDLLLLMASDLPTALPDVAPHVSNWLCSVIMKCLARDPGDRFADMDALIRALEARQPLEDEPSPGPVRSGSTRRGTLVGLLLTLLLMMGVGGYFAARSRESTASPPVTPTPPRESAPAATSPAPEPRGESAAPSAPSAPPARPPALQSGVTVRARPPKPSATPQPARDRAARARELRPEDF